MAKPSHTVDIQHLSASLKSWRKCRRLPVKMRFAKAVWLEDKLYVGGGDTPGSYRDKARLYIYTPATDMWDHTMNTPAYYFALITYRSQLVLVGGREYVNEKERGPVTNILWILTAHDQWRKTLPPMTIKCRSVSAVEFAGIISVAGGLGDERRYIDIVEVYNGHYWAKADCLPEPCSRMNLTVYNGHWYLIGGEGQGEEVFYASLESLEASCKPSEKSLPIVWKRFNAPDECSSIAVYGSRLITVGGGGYPPSSSIHAYSSHTQSWVHVGDTPVGLTSTCTAVIPTGELMVIGGESEANDAESCVYKATLDEVGTNGKESEEANIEFESSHSGPVPGVKESPRVGCSCWLKSCMPIIALLLLTIAVVIPVLLRNDSLSGTVTMSSSFKDTIGKEGSQQGNLKKISRQETRRIEQEIKQKLQPDGRPGLTQLQQLQTRDGKAINLLEAIALQYDTFATCLLDDEDGVKKNIIRQNHEFVEKKIEAIFTKFLQGGGKRPETWATVVECLRVAKLNYLADSIEQLFEDEDPQRASSSQSTIIDSDNRDWLLKVAQSGQEGEIVVYGRTIRFKAKWRIHSLKEPIVWDATAQDVESGIRIEEKHQDSYKYANQLAVRKLCEELRSRGIIHDEL